MRACGYTCSCIAHKWLARGAIAVVLTLVCCASFLREASVGLECEVAAPPLSLSLFTECPNRIVPSGPCGRGGYWVPLNISATHLFGDRQLVLVQMCVMDVLPPFSTTNDGGWERQCRYTVTVKDKCFVAVAEAQAARVAAEKAPSFQFVFATAQVHAILSEYPCDPSIGDRALGHPSRLAEWEAPLTACLLGPLPRELGLAFINLLHACRARWRHSCTRLPARPPMSCC